MAKVFNFFNRTKNNKNKRSKSTSISKSMNYGTSLSNGDLFKNTFLFSFQPFAGLLLDDANVANAVYTNSRMRASKIKPLHKKNGVLVKDNRNIKNLLRRPNKYMSWNDFIEKVSIHYDLGEAFIWIEYIENKPVNMFPLSPSSVEIVKFNDDDSIYYHFMFLNGKELYCLLEDCIHLRKNFYDINNSYIFGDTMDRILSSIVDWDYTLGEINSQLLKVSNQTLSVLEVQHTINDDDLKKLQKDFKDALNDMDDLNKVLTLKAGMKYNQVNLPESNYQKDFAESNKEKIYSAFNINQNIISGSFNSDEGFAYCQTTIQPFAQALGAELSYKLFRGARDMGDEIELRVNYLEFTSLKDRMTIFKQMFDVSSITPNEIRKYMLDMDDLENEGMNKTFTSLNYTTTSNLENYQNKKNGNTEEIVVDTSENDSNEEKTDN